MATSIIGGGSLYEGSISCYDNTFERRPYHRKCRCALHNKNSRLNSNHKLLPCCNCSNSVSYPMKKRERTNLRASSSTSSFGFQTSFDGTSQMMMINLLNLEEHEEEEEEANYKFS
ncbi:unnamed protein product [Trifolium pratense]|uniref:Uncharacterized protein n=1 Tax=Trifolium pratense TaxID=57577 RepID=A0ACB0IQ02_TRIPR|nr:unnamed protein product [Trifolium pratense]